MVMDDGEGDSKISDISFRLSVLHNLVSIGQ